MELVLDIVVLGRAARNQAGIKNRQPIGSMFVKAPSRLDDYCLAIVREELNIKEVTFKEDVEEFVRYSFKPQLKTVGPKYGKHLGIIRSFLSDIDSAKAMASLAETGSIRLYDGDTEIQASA